MTETLPHMLRADAEDNRQRVLEAARELFSERGLDVPMRMIARRAGVGPATLYRRFPTKQSLVDEAFTDELRSCQTIVAEACADADPWSGFCSFLFRIGELNARNQGFTDAFMSTFRDSVDIAAHRQGILRSLVALCRRAQQAGSMRASLQPAASPLWRSRRFVRPAPKRASTCRRRPAWRPRCSEAALPCGRGARLSLHCSAEPVLVA